MKIILTDCDGVLLDWESSFHKWMASRGHNQKNHGFYEVEHMYDMTRDRGKELITEFNNSSWMGFLPVFRDAKAGVSALEAQGYQFVCITSLSLDPYTKNLRWINLKNIFGNTAFADLICLDTGGDKDHALGVYKDSGLWWIEDKASNASLGADLGLKSILINHPHNKYHDDHRLHRVDTWNDLVEMVAREEYESI